MILQPHDPDRRRDGMAAAEIKGQLLDAAFLRAAILEIVRKIDASSAIIQAAPGAEWERLLEIRRAGDEAAERWRHIDGLIRDCKKAAAELRRAEELMGGEDAGVEFTREVEECRSSR